ncbi:MAG: LysM peptidoglycan-binding domain-containing protein [Treponema sp.]
MNTIGIKLADGSFYSILEDGSPSQKALVLTTAKDNQTRVLVDLYRSATGSMEDAEYVDSLKIDNLIEHPNGSANISLNIALNEEGKLSASINDPETGASSSSNITLISRTAEERLSPADYTIVEPDGGFQNDSDTKPERTGGLLAAASAANKKNTDADAASADDAAPSLPDFDGDATEEDTTLTADELSNIAAAADSETSDGDAPAEDSFDDIQLPDFGGENPAGDVTLPDTDAEQPSDETIAEPPVSSDEPVLPDFDGSADTEDDATLTADELSNIAVTADSETSDGDVPAEDMFGDIQLPDFGGENPTGDTALLDSDAAESSDETIAEPPVPADEPVLPDFDDSADTEAGTTLTADELSNIAAAADNESADGDAPAEDTFGDLQLPDFGGENPAGDITLPDTGAAQSSDETIAEPPSASSDEPVLPNFDGSADTEAGTTLTADELSNIAAAADNESADGDAPAEDPFGDLQLPDFGGENPVGDTASPDTDAAQPSDETIAEPPISSDEPVLPDFDDSADTEDDTTLTADELSGIAAAADNESADGDVPAENTFGDLQLPDFGGENPAGDVTLPDTDAAQASDETIAEPPAVSSDEPLLPDFDGGADTEDDTTLTADELSNIAAAADNESADGAAPAEDTFGDLQLPNFGGENPAGDVTQPDTDATQSSDETIAEPPAVSSDEPVLPDFDGNADTEDDATLTADELSNIAAAADDENADGAAPAEDTFDDLQLPDFGGENPAGDTALPDISGGEKENTADFDLPDFSGFDTEDTAPSQSPLPDFDLPDFKESENDAADSPFDFDLPDFSDFDTQRTAKTSDDGFSLESPFPDFDLPDFDEKDFSAKTADDSAFDDFQTLASDNPFPDFDLPDFPEENFSDKGEGISLSDSDFMDDLNTMTFDDEPSSPFAESGTSGINFDCLYDKETLEGHSSVGDGDEIKKKTKLPVIICVICAVICMIATGLILFVLPSKYNLLSKARVQDTAQTRPAKDETPRPEPALPPVVEAREEEIIVAPEPELVVPEPPKEPAKKAEDTLYKIKWGDTLWDISDAYYKTPWEYQMIADYNNIADPDYIVSGTTIKLPPK